MIFGACAFTSTIRRPFHSNLRTHTQRWLTVNIMVVGKKNSVESYIQEGCDEYEKRLRPTMKLQTHFLKDDEALVKAVGAAKGSTFAMDENGQQYSSRAFSKQIFKSLEDGGATVNFVIGGFAGLPQEIKDARPRIPLISLSTMTWTHQMARLLLVEQIYRSCEINKGSSYHKD
jgi:23S rRNA (pseudouridine1915-N3)-methyltransferase